MQRAVGIGRVEEDLDEHGDEVGAVAALAAELVEDLADGKAGGSAFAEEPLREPAVSGGESHLVHHPRCEPYLVVGDDTVRLREMAHHREGGGEERGLGPFARVEDVGRAQEVRRVVGVEEIGVRPAALRARGAVEVVAERDPHERAEGTTEREAEGAAENLSEPGHRLRRYVPVRADGRHYIGSHPSGQRAIRSRLRPGRRPVSALDPYRAHGPPRAGRPGVAAPRGKRRRYPGAMDLQPAQ